MVKSRVSKFAIATLLIFILSLLAIHLGHLPYETRDVTNGTFFEKLSGLKPSEIGDTLSGVFGSLAFIATAIAVIMQSRQLMAQRVELEYTRKEYEKNRVATEKMAQAAEKQFAEMRTARTERADDRRNTESKELLVEMFAGLVIYTKAISHNLEYTLYAEGPMEENEWFYEVIDEIDFFHFADDFLLFLCNELSACPSRELLPRLSSLTTAKDRCISLKRILNRIDELRPQMSRASEIMTEIRDIDNLRIAVEKLEAQISRKLDSV